MKDVSATRGTGADEFAGSWVVVTGGSRGIGRAICLEFASKGANIAFLYLKNHGAAAETQNVLSRLGVESMKHCADVGDAEAVQAAFGEITSQCRRIDVLINCAGITLDRTLLNLPPEHWHRVMNTNITGCFHCCKQTLPYMKERGYGRIVNISSVVGHSGNIGQTHYAASKAAVLGFTKSLALETAKYDITVNAVCPGFIDTQLLDSVPAEIRKEILARIPKKRWGKPEEVARVVRFLASSRSSYITGATIDINGGWHL
jgi:NAD(P)-dependent dehydrogenase (short-subunit alcohol dehydrogenase family)